MEKRRGVFKEIAVRGGIAMDMADFKQGLGAISSVIYYDRNEYLREKTSNSLKLVQLIRQGESLVEGRNKKDQYFLYGALGNLYRMNGQPKKAITYLTYCLRYAQAEGDATREVISLIRLGEAVKYDHNPTKALRLFDRALDMCENDHIDAYVDFVLQHKGKCLMELGRYEDAEACFIKALHLRQLKEDTSLIHSTVEALAFVREKMHT